MLKRAIAVTALCVALAIGAAVTVSSSPLVLASLLLLAVMLVPSEKSKWVLFSLIIYTPFEEFLLNFVPAEIYFAARFAPLALLGGVLLGMLGRRFLRYGKAWHSTPIDVPLLAFCLLAAFSLVINRLPLEAGLLALQPLLRFIFLGFYFIVLADFKRRDGVLMVSALLAATFVEAAIGLSQSILGEPAWRFFAPKGGAFAGHLVGGLTQEIQGGRYQIFGTLTRYNHFGALMGMAVLLALPFFQRHRNLRPILGLFLTVSLLAMVLASARAPWLGLLGGVWLMFALRRQLTAVVLPILLAIVLILTLDVLSEKSRYFGTLGGPNSFDRLLEPLSEDYLVVASRAGRLFYLGRFPASVLAQNRRAFLLGFGPGSLGKRAMDIFGLNTLDDVGVPRQTQHLIVDVGWIYIFGQVGVIGLTLFLWMLLRLYRTTLALRRSSPDPFVQDLALGFAGLLAYFLLATLFNPLWEYRTVSLYFWVIAGILIKLGTRSLEEAPAATASLEKGLSK